MSDEIPLYGKCGKCGAPVLMPVSLAPGVVIRNVRIITTCPQCNALATVEIEHLQVAISRVVQVLVADPQPLRRAREALAAAKRLQGVKDLKAARRSGAMAKLKGIVPGNQKELRALVISLSILIGVMVTALGAGEKIVDALGRFSGKADAADNQDAAPADTANTPGQSQEGSNKSRIPPAKKPRHGPSSNSRKRQ